ncbi:penicillin V acylase-like amidase (Ntn superfamily) [Ancylobacter aquaticus]|uniref:Penicillin V acylase-like amidase (Ntn superfamily) n=1 Tax=Ancylobacter aquaticus TaxID=100 RepID=A0A4R1I3L2_ANCAQ|nr:linear amide C-N hydrolase [Ancylobacter aquaticus]TCK28591.1 penicillin V acylase-like amidase (Ntn superfamily) [Ancylobacter aquaticus]
MCTSLGYRDAGGRAYFGRTLELTIDLPYQIAFFPAGFRTRSQVEGHPATEYTARYAMLAVTMPYRVPTPEAPAGIDDLKVLEGLNDQGLTFSLLSYPTAGGGYRSVAMTQAVLSASDLGSWCLGQFATVAEVKAAVAAQPILLVPLAMLGGVESPFHYVVHDATGAALVIEFDRGEMKIYDNPVGVMTNGPDFGWHLTNLNNYTFLSNVDKSSASFGGYTAVQPDSGIATAGLPASNTSVGRFVRAAYYAQFTEKAATPDLAVQTLAHVLNNFDRPRGVSIDPPGGGGGHMEVAGLDQPASETYATEYTCWTSLSDLDRKLFFLRDYRSLNFSRFDLAALADATEPKVLPLHLLHQEASDATAALKAATAT